MRIMLIVMLVVLYACGGEDQVGELAKGTEKTLGRGPAGDRGPVGPMGPQGEKGEQGEKGDTVINEIDPVVPDTWDDPVTGRKWTIGPEVNATNVSCSSGYEVPDVNDFNEAKSNGLAALLDDLGASTYVWLKNLSNSVVESYRDLNDGSVTNSLVGGSLFCVETN